MKQNNNRTQFAICVADDLPSLEQGKIYRVLPDAKGAEINWLRIVDDSGEDYLYPSDAFEFVKPAASGTPHHWRFGLKVLRLKSD